MTENEEVGLLQVFSTVAEELPKLRESIDNLAKVIQEFGNEPILLAGFLFYDCVEVLKELKDLFKWYAETTTRGKYPGR